MSQSWSPGGGGNGMKRQLMRNVAKLKLQNFRHMVRGSADKPSLCVLERAVARRGRHGNGSRGNTAVMAV